MKNTPSTLISCELTGSGSGISIKTSKQLDIGNVVIKLQAVNLYATNVPTATAFNIRTCASATCASGSLIDNY